MLPGTVKKYFIAILQEFQTANPDLMEEVSETLFQTIELTRDIQKKLQIRKQNRLLIEKYGLNAVASNQLDVRDDIDSLLGHISVLEDKIQEFEEPNRLKLKDTIVRYVKQELQDIISYEEKLSEAELALR